MLKDEKATIMSFYENWVELMEMCNPEEWYELCTIMTNLRFKGEDTKTKEIENIKVKMAWNLIRPSILKSNRDSKYNKNKRNHNMETVNIENKPILNPSNDVDDKIYQPEGENAENGLKMAFNEEFPIPEQTIQEVNVVNPVYDNNMDITDEEKYGETVMNLLDEYGNEIDQALLAFVENRYFNDENKKTLADGAVEKVRTIAKNYGLRPDTENWYNLQQYTADTIAYFKTMIENKLNNEIETEYAA